MALTEISVAGASRANANLLRLKAFVNGLEGETVTLDDASTVKTLRGLIQEILDQAFIDAKVDTEAALLADLDWPADSLGIGLDTMVVYRKTGAAGAGSWTEASDVLAQFAGTASQEEVDAVETLALLALRYPPAPIGANASGALRWVLNEDDAEAASPGSLHLKPGYIQHPALGRQEIGAAVLETPFNGALVPQYGAFWIVWSETNPNTRFALSGGDGTGHPNLFTVYLSNGVVKAAGGGTAVDYVAAASDVALFAGTKKTADPGLGGLVPLFAAIASAGTGPTPVNAPQFYKPLPSMTGLIAGQQALPFRLRDYVQTGDVILSGLSFSVSVTPAGGAAVDDPDWVTIDDTDRVTFDPEAAGQGVYTIEVDDGQGNVISASANYSAVISAPDPGPDYAPPEWIEELPAIFALRVNSSTLVDLAALVSDADTPKANLVFTALSAIPGTRVNGSVWEVTPSQTGTFTQRIRVTDPQGGSATIEKQYTVGSFARPPGSILLSDFAEEITL